MKTIMEIAIWNRTGMGKCINKLIYWWNIMYHKREIKCKWLKKTVADTVVGLAFY